MLTKTTSPLKNNDTPLPGYGLGFLVGIFTGLMSYFFYGTKQGATFLALITESHQSTPNLQTTINKWRQKIKEIQQHLKPFIQDEVKATKKVIEKPIIHPPSRRYFKKNKP